MGRIKQALTITGMIMTLLVITSVQSYASEVIYACISKSGQIRIVNSTDSCRTNEYSAQWENGESGLSSLYNTWAASTEYNTDRAESYGWCTFGGTLISGGCECGHGVVEASMPERSDVNNDGTIEDSWKCVCVNPLGSPADFISAKAHARCAS